MTTANVKYDGNLRTVCTHLKSGREIITDAPVDNNGNGDAFSPTDLTATSLASCMITVMGIAARQRDIEFSGARAEVTKVMLSDPRRIGKIQIVMKIPDHGYTDKTREILKNTARTCPVAKSLHPEIEVDLSFVFD
ncbi:MAG: OsmC family protein [Cryomorphaceae bacterium]|nr:OsmC family protein [Flavobacteriales bacterium]